MHPFHDYLSRQLRDQLRKKPVFVLYDPAAAFTPFIDELPLVAEDGPLPRVRVAELATHLARFRGSFFALRDAVEPLVAQGTPEPLLIHLPGFRKPDPQRSVLLELEAAGNAKEWQFRSMARRCLLRESYTEGAIDKMLAPANADYADVVALLGQRRQVEPSMLKVILNKATAAELLATWLADDGHDQTIGDKEAVDELLELIRNRLGLEPPPGDALAATRDRTWRYLLINEFRFDLDAPAPASVAMIPEAPSEEHEKRIRELAARMRKDHGQVYVTRADEIETVLGLRDADLEAAALGRIDTFRFEEQRLLAHAGALVIAERYADALAIVDDRRRSFWVDRELGRQAQWETCRLIAALGLAVTAVRPALRKIKTGATAWVRAYAAGDGWHRADHAYRKLEALVAGMDDEPELEQALALIRQRYEDLLTAMAEGFAQAFRDAGWAVPDVVHQTGIHARFVAPAVAPVAYFLVDAMRYEMGVELAEQLREAEDVTIQPAVAALPSITPIGMAALMPGASASFSVVAHGKKGNLAARIADAVLPGPVERRRWLEAQVAGASDLTLETLLQTPAGKLRRKLAGAPLIAVRSQEIDALGEMATMARRVMDDVIGNVARAVRKLAKLGFASFVITADHGHQFAQRKDEHMRIDSPGGEKIEVHRRFWSGRGGTTPPATVRVGAAELGYDSDFDFVFPTGLGVLRSSGGLSYHHGGFSLQELLVPVLILRMPTADAAAAEPRSPYTVELREHPAEVTNRILSAKLTVEGTLFAQEPLVLRVVLTAGNRLVGQARMAVGGRFDAESGCLTVAPGAAATVGLMLNDDRCEAVRIAVQDPTSDAVLARSEELPVRLGI